MPAVFASYHPFIVLSMATAIMSLFFYALRFHLGFILSYVLLANPAAILHQLFLMDYLYTSEDLTAWNVDPVSFPWNAWVAITITFAIFSLFAQFLRTSMDGS